MQFSGYAENVLNGKKALSGDKKRIVHAWLRK
jgi:hypothetical protein